MRETLLAAYQATAYQVRLAQGGCASLRIGEVPPGALQPLIGVQPWAFITAWNPYSQATSASLNRRAQHDLLATLHALPSCIAVRAGRGLGSGGWHEASLFVVGPEPAQMDVLADRYRQNAYVHGRGGAPAQLRLRR